MATPGNFSFRHGSSRRLVCRHSTNKLIIWSSHSLIPRTAREASETVLTAELSLLPSVSFDKAAGGGFPVDWFLPFSLSPFLYFVLPSIYPFFVFLFSSRFFFIRGKELFWSRIFFLFFFSSIAIFFLLLFSLFYSLSCLWYLRYI